MSGDPAAPWTTAISRAAWTLLLAVLCLFVTWQLLRQLLVPLVLIVVLIGIIRLAVSWSRRDGW